MLETSLMKFDRPETGAPLSLDELLAKLRFLEPVEHALRKKLRDPALPAIAKEAYAGEGFAFPLCRRMPLTRLSALAWLLVEAWDRYGARGVPEGIILDTFRDVSLRARLYYEATGKAGLRREDVIWYRHIVQGTLFQIGSLQFQPFEMVYLDRETLGEAYMLFDPGQKESLPPGTPVINCHIPRGANLALDAVEPSFRRAKAFFGTLFPERDFQAFVCYSWLLYPSMTACLRKDSRIRRFAGLFRVIGTCGDREQAMENLFPGGKAASGEKLTSLQRMAKTHPERFGFACGIRSVQSV